jgi:hypothetical protein
MKSKRYQQLLGGSQQQSVANFGELPICLQVHLKYPEQVSKVINKVYDFNLKARDVMVTKRGNYNVLLGIGEPKQEKIPSPPQVAAFIGYNAVPYPKLLFPHNARPLSNTFECKFTSSKGPSKTLLTPNQLSIYKRTLDNSKPYIVQNIGGKDSSPRLKLPDTKIRTGFHVLISKLRCKIEKNITSSSNLVKRTKLDKENRHILKKWIHAKNFGEKRQHSDESTDIKKEQKQLHIDSNEVIVSKTSDKGCGKKNILRIEHFNFEAAYAGDTKIHTEVMKLYGMENIDSPLLWNTTLVAKEVAFSEKDLMTGTDSSEEDDGIETVENNRNGNTEIATSSFQILPSYKDKNKWSETRNRRGTQILKKALLRHRSMKTFAEPVNRKTIAQANLSKEKGQLKNTEGKMLRVWYETSGRDSIASIARRFYIQPDSIFELNRGVFLHGQKSTSQLPPNILLTLKVNKHICAGYIRVQAQKKKNFVGSPKSIYCKDVLKTNFEGKMSPFRQLAVEEIFGYHGRFHLPQKQKYFRKDIEYSNAYPIHTSTQK